MTFFQVKVEKIGGWIAELTGLNRQIPFAASRAINTTAFAVDDALKLKMGMTFKGGATPWTRRAFRVIKSDKTNLKATVELDPSDGSKTSDYEAILGHLFTGGQRRFKRMEGAFRRIGVLRSGEIIVPGAACPLDSFGNAPSSLVVQLISYFQGFGEQGYKANMSAEKKGKLAKIGVNANGYKTINGKVYFISRGRGMWYGRMQHLPAGIWVKSGVHGADVKPVFLFVRVGTYKQLIDIDQVAAPVIDRVFPAEFQKELAFAVKTAK